MLSARFERASSSHSQHHAYLTNVVNSNGKIRMNANSGLVGRAKYQNVSE